MKRAGVILIAVFIIYLAFLASSTNSASDAYGYTLSLFAFTDNFTVSVTLEAPDVYVNQTFHVIGTITADTNYTANSFNATLILNSSFTLPNNDYNHSNNQLTGDGDIWNTTWLVNATVVPANYTINVSVAFKSKSAIRNLTVFARPSDWNSGKVIVNAGGPYNASEAGIIYATLRDKNSRYVNIIGICNTTIFYPNGTNWKINKTMSYLNGTHGQYYYNFLAPGTLGNYTVHVNCTKPVVSNLSRFDLQAGAFNATPDSLQILVPSEYYFYTNIYVYQSGTGQNVTVQLNKSSDSAAGWIKFMKGSSPVDVYNISVQNNTQNTTQIRVWVPEGNEGTYSPKIYAFSLNDTRSDTITVTLKVNDSNPIDDVEITSIDPSALYGGQAMNVSVKIHKISPPGITDVTIYYCLVLQSLNYDCNAGTYDISDTRAINVWLNYTKTIPGSITATKAAGSYYMKVAVQYKTGEEIPARAKASSTFQILSAPSAGAGAGGAGAGGGGAAPVPQPKLNIGGIENFYERTQGDTLKINVAVNNTGSAGADNTTLTASGVPFEWIFVTPERQDIAVNETRQYSLTIKIPLDISDQIFFPSVVAKSGSATATKSFTVTVSRTTTSQALLLINRAKDRKGAAHAIVEKLKEHELGYKDAEEKLFEADALLELAIEEYEKGYADEASSGAKSAIVAYEVAIKTAEGVFREAYLVELQGIEADRMGILERIDPGSLEALDEKINKSRIYHEEGRALESYEAILDARGFLDRVKNEIYWRELLLLLTIIAAVAILAILILALTIYKKKKKKVIKEAQIRKKKELRKELSYIREKILRGYDRDVEREKLRRILKDLEDTYKEGLINQETYERTKDIILKKLRGG